MKTIIGESWRRELTDEEFDEFMVYDENLNMWIRSQIPLENILDMFLNHFRRGINLNKKVCK